MKTLKKWGTFLQGFIILNVIWWIGSVIVDSRALPSPIKIYESLPKLLGNDFYLHILASVQRLSIGLIISLAIGLVVGLLMGYSKRVNKILNPVIYFTYPVPKTALLPVVMILYGLGDASKITIIVLITVFQVIVSVRDAVVNIPSQLYNPLKSLGASNIQLFKNVTFPAILSDLLTNIRLLVGTALSVLFFAEAYGTTVGLGYYIQDAWTRIDYISMYGAILVLSIVGVVLFLVIDLIEDNFCRWKKDGDVNE